MITKILVIIMFLLIQFNIFSNSSIVVGTTTCLDEKSSPPEIDYLEIKIDTNQVVNITNSTLTLVLDDNIKQQFFDYVTLGLEFINTIESENITIEYSSKIGTIENNNRRIIVNFSTDGSIESTKIYISIEKAGINSINSLNKDHCEELLSLLVQADNMIIDIQRQKDLFNSSTEN